jgi:hypothetical protein
MLHGLATTSAGSTASGAGAGTAAGPAAGEDDVIDADYSPAG